MEHIVVEYGQQLCKHFNKNLSIMVYKFVALTRNEWLKVINFCSPFNYGNGKTDVFGDGLDYDGLDSFFL